MHMKALPFGQVLSLAVVVIVLSESQASSQGTIAAGNSALTRIRVDEDSDGIQDRNATANDGFTIGFFYGPANSDPNQLFLTATISSTTAGVLVGAPSVTPIDGTEPYNVVSLRVRGWSSSFGTNWQAASNSVVGTFAQTKIAQVTLGKTAGPGAVIWQTSDTSPSRILPLVIPMSTKPRVSIAMEGVGVVTKFPDEETYEIGTVVEVTALPSRWHTFSKWSDNDTANPRLITVTTNIQLVAVFTPTTPLETLQFGSISRLAPIGMSAFFVDGAYVGESNVVKRGNATISMQTSFPNGRLFLTTDDSTPDVTSLLYRTSFSTRKSMTLRAKAYSADFSQSAESDPLEIEILPTTTATTKGGGSVTVQPPAGAYFSGRMATVTATPLPGWQLMQWLGDVTGNGPSASLTIDRNRCVQAVFGTSFATSVSGSGSVITSPESDWLPFQTQVRLTAVPEAGHYFVLWGNAANETNNPLNFTIQSPNPEVTAVFAALPDNQETLTVIPNGLGSVSITPRANRYLHGTNVTIVATPQSGQNFLGWTGGAVGTSNPLVVTLNQSMVIGAEFTKHPKLTTAICEGASTLGENKLLITGEIGGNYLVQSASTLAIPSNQTEWTPLAVVTNQFGTVQFNNSFATNAGSIIYRAILLP